MTALFSKIIDKIQEYIIIFFIAMCTVVGTLQVISRFVFNFSIPWSEELIRYSFVWIVFLGAALAVRDDQHASITMLVDVLSKKISNLFRIIANMCCLVFLYFMVFQGFNVVKMQLANNQLTAATELPIAFVTIMIPIGAILMGYYYIIEIVKFSKIFFAKNDKEG